MRKTYCPSKTILEGCNGHWAQKHYMPALIGKAARRYIALWAIDVEENVKLSSPEIEQEWQIAEKRGTAFYINKVEGFGDCQALFNAESVFIATPDRFHCETAKFWLDRLAPKGKIFIEKPLDTELGPALDLQEALRTKTESAVFGFDHYLARAFPFLQKRDEYIGEIGEIERIECHILEPFGIPPNRVKALDKGIVLDLFCHILSLAAATAGSSQTTMEEVLRHIEIIEVKAAQCSGSPISGETFAWIRFHINRIEVESVIGKYVDSSEEKSMTIHGSKGRIELDLLRDEFFITDQQRHIIERANLNPRHVESYIEALVRGEEPLSAPGVLSFDAAFEILKVLNEAKILTGNIIKYQAGETITGILERF